MKNDTLGTRVCVSEGHCMAESTCFLLLEAIVLRRKHASSSPGLADNVE